MTITVLSNLDVNELLQRLSSDDVADLAHALNQALVQSSSQEDKQYQPRRSVMSRPGGQVSLFMPGTTQDLVGVKTVGILPSTGKAPALPMESPVPSLHSNLTLCDATGRLIAVLNATELTAFRTALGSMLLYRLRRDTGNVLVFGAGKQALWHIRLAVLIRGQDIRTVTIVNRSRERTQDLVRALTNDPKVEWPKHITLRAFDEETASLEAAVVAADVVFCTTPSTVPLFPGSFLMSENARAKSRYVAAIGSYRTDMAELAPELLKEVVNASGVFAGQVWNGKIVVDTTDGCLEEAGELVQAGLDSDQLFNMGALELERRKPGSRAELDEWLHSGFVVYKSVGTAVMDLEVGRALFCLASAKSIGVQVPF